VKRASKPKETQGSEMKIGLERDEALACVIVLENRKRPYKWEKSALKKLLKAMGLKSITKR